ncbi:MAG: leucine-rich repeat protein, partial [Lentisphaeria bacterium]|nr:leucine-rich repeat protein [Lentisphaeria bacterium]
CSGSMAKEYLRWNEFAAALDNRTLEFTLDQPEYWSVSTAQSKHGGSAVYLDLGSGDGSPPNTAMMRARVAGPGLLSFWLYPEQPYISIYFGEVAASAVGGDDFMDGPIPGQFVTSYQDSHMAWKQVSVEIPEGDFTVGWRFGAWGQSSAAFIDRVSLMHLEGLFGYEINEDGAGVTLMAYLGNQNSGSDPAPIALDLPATLGGLPVTAIGRLALANLPLAEVTIPASVTAIGDYAFSGCAGLAEISLPVGVTALGEGVFDGCGDLLFVHFAGPAPTAGEGDLGSQAAILFEPGQPGWEDGGTYRGMLTITISGERVDQPEFSRGDVPAAAFTYFNQAFQLDMSGPADLAIRYALGGAVPTAASPGLLYQAPLELDDATGDIAVCARVFRDGQPCSGATRVTFRNAKALSEILECFDAIFVLRDPAKWQVIEETNDQDEVVNRFLQAGPYPQPAVEQAHLDFFVHYPEVPDRFSFRWRLVSELPDAGLDDAGQWKFELEEHPSRWNSQYDPTWQTTSYAVTASGWLAGAITFGDAIASQPGISHLELDRIKVITPRVVPEFAVDPPGAGQITYWSDYAEPPGWQLFTGSERMLVGTSVRFQALPDAGYQFVEWRRHDPEVQQYLPLAADNPRDFLVEADLPGNHPGNDYLAVFAAVVPVTVTLSEGGVWPPLFDYAQGSYEQGGQVITGTELKFRPEPLPGHGFLGWSDGVPELERTVVCTQPVTLRADFARCVTCTPAATVVNTGDASAIAFTSGAGPQFNLNADGTVTFTIVPEYPANHRFSHWEFDATQGVEAHAVGQDLVVTMDWDLAYEFSPRAFFYQQSLVTVRPAAGHTGRGLLSVRLGGADGPALVLDASQSAAVDCYQTLWLRATPLGMNRFIQWTSLYGGNQYVESYAPEIIFMPRREASYVLEATFLAQAPLTLRTDPAGNGNGSFNVNGQPYQPDALFDIGRSVQFEVIPETNNRFVHWLDNGATAPSRTVYIEPGENLYTARIVRTGTVIMTAKVITTGEPGGGVTQTYQPELGSSITLTATPLPGFRFVRWEDNGSTSPSRLVADIGTADLQFIALFTPVVAVSAAAPSGGGSFTGTGEMPLSDFPVTVKAVAQPGWRFGKWLDDANMPAERVLTADDVRDNRIDLQAMFVRVHEVLVQPFPGLGHLGSIVITDAGGAVFSPLAGTGAFQAYIDAGARISFQAVPNPNCDFVRWGWDGSSNPQVVGLLVDRPLVFSAFFAERATLLADVKTGQESWGTVALHSEGVPVQPGTNFRVGQWVQITAIPQENIRFLRWQDGLSTAVRHVQVQEGEQALLAEFVRTASVTVNLTTDTPGEAPDSMMWALNGTAWQPPGATCVFDVEGDDGFETVLEFAGQLGWNLPVEHGQTIRLLPRQNQTFDCSYRKITTGTLVGRLDPGGIVAQWRVKPNAQTGYPGSEWLAPGAAVVIEQGEYEIEFTQVLDEEGQEAWLRPDTLTLEDGESATVTVTAGQRRAFTGKYRQFVPDLGLDFSPGEASEGAGPGAVIATLRRLPRTPGGAIDTSEAITVRLAASEMDSLIHPSAVTIPQGHERVQFTVGVVDNAWRENTEILAADGETVLGRGRVLRLTGLVALPSNCNCSGAPSSGAEIFAELAVYDNDGPALLVTANPSTMQEPEPGQSEKVHVNALTIRRNDHHGEGLPAMMVSLSALL